MNFILPLVPTKSFDQLTLKVFRITGQCRIPKAFVGNAKYVVAMRSDVEPSPAVSEERQSLVYSGIIFQYLQASQSFIVHSQFCGSSFTRDSLSLTKDPLIGDYVFKHNLQDMKSLVEGWTFQSLSPDITVLPITKVQAVFQDMYVKANADSIQQQQSKLQNQIDEIRKLFVI